MGFVTQNVVSRGATIKFQFIDSQSTRPKQYDITLQNAVNANSSSIVVRSSDRVKLQHNTELKFKKTGPFFNVEFKNKGALKLEINNNGVLPANPPQLQDTLLINGRIFHRIISVETTSTSNIIGINPPLRQAIAVDDEVEILTDVIIDLPNVSGLNESIEISESANTTIPVLPITAPLDSGAVAQTYALVEMLGISDASPVDAPQTTDATDHLSALSGNQKNVATVVNATLTISGFRIKNDRAQSQVLMESLNDSERQASRLWVEAYSSDGDFRSGTATITDSSNTDTATNLAQFNRTLTFVDDYTWISGDNAVYIPPLNISELPNLPAVQQIKFDQVARLIAPDNPSAVLNLIKDGYWWNGIDPNNVGNPITTLPSWGLTKPLIAVASNRPTQGENGIEFDGVANYLDGGSVGILPAQDEFAVTLVIAPSAAYYTDNGVLFSQYEHPAKGLLWGFNLGGNIGQTADILVSMTIDPNSTSIITIHRKGNQFIERINGEQMVRTGAFDINQTGFLIGARPNSTLSYNSSPTEFLKATIKGVIVTITSNINVPLQEDFARYYYAT